MASTGGRSTGQTVGDLKQALIQQHALWQVDPSLKDSDLLPKYPPGTSLKFVNSLLARARITARREFVSVLREIGPPNGYLARVWEKAGLIGSSEADLYGDPPDRDQSELVGEYRPPASEP